MRYFILISLGVMGCTPGRVAPPPSGSFYPGMAAASGIAVAVAGVRPAPPSPTPVPTPVPPKPAPDGKTCQVCDGVGKVDYDHDGNYDADCLACGGDGVADKKPPVKEWVAVDHGAKKPHAPPIEWLSWGEALAAVKAGNDKPILAHVSAAGCAPCFRMERDVFTSQDVRKAAEGFVMVKVDANASYGQTTFWKMLKVDSVPVDIIYDHHGKERARYLGGVTAPGEYAKRLVGIRSSFNRMIERENAKAASRE